MGRWRIFSLQSQSLGATLFRAIRHVKQIRKQKSFSVGRITTWCFEILYFLDEVIGSTSAVSVNECFFLPYVRQFLHCGIRVASCLRLAIHVFVYVGIWFSGNNQKRVPFSVKLFTSTVHGSYSRLCAPLRTLRIIQTASSVFDLFYANPAMTS